MHWAVIARSLVLVAALALAAGCNGKAGGGPAATIPPSSTSTSAPSDPYAVPAVIDEAYVNRVLAALDQVEGDVVRSLVANRVPQVDDTARLRAIYNDPQYQLEVDGLLRQAQRGVMAFKTPPGNRKTTVSRVITARPDCILVETSTDYSDVVLAPAPAGANEGVFLVTLRPTQPSADPHSLNVTPYSVSNSEVLRPGEAPKERSVCPS
ncbi:MAG TPA: hypothetical protein VK988_17985 [Acidimicrobiales bacterium]|nr:hypothetical protein [Acidimicrobiales bacterium]